jgi:hypothetical protein
MFTKRFVVLVFALLFAIILILEGCTSPTLTTTYTITSSAGEGGQINPEGEVTLSEGGSQTFTITPNDGYEIDDVLVDDESIGAETSYTFANIQQDHSIQANFLQQTQDSLTITATSGTGGSIYPKGSVKVNKGNDQTFTITPDAGYQIANVLVDGTSVGKKSTYIFQNVQENHTIQANFSAIKYTVTLSVYPTGSFSLVVYGEGSYNVGDAVQISAVSDPGAIYYFAWWYDNDNNQIVSSDATYNFIMPAADVNYTAHFGPFF